MVILYSLLGILMVLLILLLIPVSMRVSYQDQEVKVSAHYLFLTYTLFPVPEEELGKKHKKKMKKREPEQEEPEPIEKGFLEKVEEGKKILELGLSLLKPSKKALRTIKKHLIFYNVELYALVGGEDAHEIGENYGKQATAFTLALGFVDSFFRLKKTTVWVQPNFISGESDYEAHLRIKIRPCFVLSAGISFFISFLNVYFKEKGTGKSSEQPKKKRAKPLP